VTSGNAYTITGGAIRGNNLFHSFDLFSVPSSGSATFNGPSAIANILSRVTGGQPSTIEGIINSRTSMPTANFYLINPSGVIFKSGAQLEVGGSFHVSTADYLRLDDGVQFLARPVPGDLLTAAPPIAFGFLGPTPAPISIQGGTLEVPNLRTLSVVGGDVQMVGGTLKASGGRIQIASTASAREVVLTPDPDVGSFTGLGRIDVSGQAVIDASGVAAVGAGTVLIRGGRLIVDNSNLAANTVNGNGAARGIDFQTAEDIVLPNGISVGTQTSGAGLGGDIALHTGT